eukprot:764171-Hanusia_phi.AAC.14
MFLTASGHCKGCAPTASSTSRSGHFSKQCLQIFRLTMIEQQLTKDVLRHWSIATTNQFGFTRLSDRFQGLGQEGIDSLTSTINRMFSTIIKHVEAWAGDIVKFAGDAVIVIWECDQDTLAKTIQQAVTCAMELERLHGTFKVHVPDANTLEFADQLARHFATAALVDADKHDGGDENGWLASAVQLEGLEIRRRLRAIAWLKVLTSTELAMLAEQCKLQRFSAGDVIIKQGAPADSMLIVHSGMVNIFVKKESESADQSMTNSIEESIDHGEEIATLEEGEIVGEMALLTHQKRTATVVAGSNCVMIHLSYAALVPLLSQKPEIAQELADMKKAYSGGKRYTAGVTLRLHQSLSCGPMWFAHVGGAQLDKHNGARKEFLVIGKALLEAADALEEAAIGTLVVSKAAWTHIESEFQAEETKEGNFKILGYTEPSQSVNPPGISIPENPTYTAWPILKMYCHEGARDLQDIAPFAADLRKMTVMFVRLHLDLEAPDYDTVLQTHRALLAIQVATYRRKGTLRQFLQDDKGLLAICVMGMPPFSPHENDPVRAVLAGLEMRKWVQDLSIKLSIGITTGTAYSGFVGSSTRREMCAMGSVCNMAARLMCKAGENVILVDKETHDASSLMIEFEQMPAVKVKGRDTPLEVFNTRHNYSYHFLKRKVIDLLRQTYNVQHIPPPLESYFVQLIQKGECSPSFVKNVCANLVDNGHIFRTRDGAIVSRNDLSGLDNGLTRMQALGRGEFGDRLLVHVQMLVKVVCFLSHNALFTINLARHVYSSTFPNFAPDFEPSIQQLITLGMLQPARIEDMKQMLSTDSSTCHECANWQWQTPTIQSQVHAQLLQYKGNLANENFSNNSFTAYVNQKNPKTGIYDVYKVVIPGLVESVNQSLLKSYQRIWHHFVAEYYEDSLDLNERSSHLILAHHWSHAADHGQVGVEDVHRAANYLHLAAHAAMAECSYLPAIELLQRACRILDRVPLQKDIADRKLMLLAEMAPHTLLVYGHGSPESIAAYHGLHRLIPQSEDLDDLAVPALAGICVNLYGRQLYDVGAKIARRIYKSGKRTSNRLHEELGMASLIPALYFTGEFESLFHYMESLKRIHDDYVSSGSELAAVNGVIQTIVALSSWAPALVVVGDLHQARIKLEEVVKMAEETAHPPTLCVVLCTLANDYFPLTGEVGKCEEFSLRALNIAHQYDLGHCTSLANRAKRWACNPRINAHFSMLQDGNILSERGGLEFDEEMSDFGSLLDSESASVESRDGESGYGAFGSNVGPHTQKIDPILSLQCIAVRGDWELVKSRITSCLPDVLRLGSYLQSEYLRLLCASKIMTASDKIDLFEEAETRESWVKEVRDDLQKCCVLCGSRKFFFLYLLCSLDWLRFEMHYAELRKAEHMIEPSMILAMNHVKCSMDGIRDGEDQFHIMLAKELLHIIAKDTENMYEALNLDVNVDEDDVEMKYAEHEIHSTTGRQSPETPFNFDSPAGLLGLFDDDVAGLLGVQKTENFEDYEVKAGQDEEQDESRPAGDEPPQQETRDVAMEEATSVHTTLMPPPQLLASFGDAKLSHKVSDHLSSLERGIEELMTSSHVSECLQTAHDWNFNPFVLNEVTGGKPVQVLGLFLLKTHGCIDNFALDSARLVRFLQEIESGMPKSNPYHNAIHCADVTQKMHMFISKGGIGEFMGPTDILAALLAAIIHDFEHLGLNNDILVKMGHERALLHNDKAPNENHHLAAAFRILKRADCNFMHSVPQLSQSKIRKLIIDMVLATDMGEHQRMVSLIRTELLHRVQKRSAPELSGAPNGAGHDGSKEAGGPPEVDEQSMILMLRGAIKMCDLGHAYAELDVHVQWSQRLEDELFRQGDVERSLGLPVSYLMDRNKPGVTKSQVGFFELVVNPLAVAWVSCFPASELILERLKANLQHWRLAEQTRT